MPTQDDNFEATVLRDALEELQNDEHYIPFPLVLASNDSNKHMTRKMGQEIIDKIERLDRRIALMMGDQVLINGKLVSFESLKKGVIK